jgi:hypothetical protein
VGGSRGLTWQAVQVHRHAEAQADPAKDADRHAPVLDRMLDIVRGGQASGDFDASVQAHWLLSASLALGRAAEDEVKAGRMTIEQASREIRPSAIWDRPGIRN